MRELDTTYESWSKKKIIFGVSLIVILVVLGFIVKDSFIDKKIISFLPVPKFKKTAVAGMTAKKEETSSEDSGEGSSNTILKSSKLKVDIQKKLDAVKKEFSSLSATDIASSSPQFKKVMEDIQNLKDLPEKQAKEACYNICRGL